MDLPDVLIAPWQQFAREGVPPPFTRCIDPVIETLRDHSGPFPQNVGSGLGVAVVRFVPLGTYGIVRTDAQPYARNLPVLVTFPGTPQMHICNESGASALEIVRQSAQVYVDTVLRDIR